MANLAITGILEKMTGKDKDFRYMATSDLLNELNKEGFKLDNDLEIKLSNIVIQQLDDAAGDVSALAVKCLGLLVKKIREEQVLDMTNKLCDKLVNGKDQHRDIASIALKTIVSEVPTSSVAQSVLVSVSPKLIKGVTSPGMSTEIKCECLDILCDVLHKFGNLMASDHEMLLGALLPQLSSNQASVRKKTVSCIASLASNLSDDLLAKATVEVIRLLKTKGTKSDMARTNIQMIGALRYAFKTVSCVVKVMMVMVVDGVFMGLDLAFGRGFQCSELDDDGCDGSKVTVDGRCRAVGYRFGPHLGETVPVLINYCMSASENDEELREYSLQALESFLLRCHRDISPYCNEILHLALEFLSYDPNFTDNMEEDTDNESNEEDEDDESANEYTDDEDVSWKVRRASAKCLAAFIVSRPEMISKLYEEVGAFSVLKELVVVLPDCLADHIGSLIPGIEKALCDKSSTSNLKIEALIFTRLVLASHSPSVFHPYIKAVSSSVLFAIAERYYKVTAEALRVCGELVRVVRPNIEGYGFDFKPYVHPIYNAIMARLTNQDQDQEVKECAISCMGLVVATFGDNLRADLPTCLPVLVDRMGNEITRLTAVKAFAVIAASSLHLDLSCVLDHVIAELTAFLRKANRALRQATLGTLNTLIVAYGDKIGSDAYEVIIALQSFFATLVQSANTSFDVLLDSLLSSAKPSSQSSAVAKQALFSIAQCVAVLCLAAGDQKCSSTVKMLTGILKVDSSTNSAISFVKIVGPSSSVKGEERVDVIGLASAIATNKGTPKASALPSNSYREMLWPADGEIGSRSLPTGRVSGNSLAKDGEGFRICSRFSCIRKIYFKKIESIELDLAEATKHLALLCLGEIGRRKDLSAHAHIENMVIESFQSPFEEIKSAASYALGNIAVGNLPKYLPFILNQIDNQQKKQYLLLHSLKEVIVRQSVDKADFQDSSVEKILNLLFNHCESEEEGVRNVVAECLGKIALIKPAKLVPALKVRTTNQAAFTRATVVIAVKYSMVERPEKIDEIIYPEISSFLMLIKDHDRHVRRAAVLALSTAAHNKPNLIKGLLPELLPLLYDQTLIKKELIRTVDLGPFKHTVDDGLELRKAAFECVDTLLDSCLDQVNPSSFIVPYLRSGLDDHYDVKMPCHLILSKLAEKCPSSVLAVLESLVDPLQKTTSFRPKQDAVKQEVDRNEDMIRSALRAVASLNRIGELKMQFQSPLEARRQYKLQKSWPLAVGIGLEMLLGAC
ncbi:hypothetical protein RJ639_041335 [Escallonia herrerae]|uniref:TATA-binding protein interacting (TIP20) domain-containing protein n=1 Tax=Escallonia herrerae TaxID=1293975 RepID=A0AA88WEK3_9ASTE|nr:hypothetical protein RJ639_041335 [Escallonia herrerae]